MILLITLQNGLGYTPVKAGGVTLGFALALAIGSARSAVAARGSAPGCWWSAAP